MSLTPEEFPNGVNNSPVFDPGDWLGPKNYRDLVHGSRDALFSEIRTALDAIEPQLATNGGLAFYETYVEDASRVGILVTTRPEVASPNSTVICINKLRQPVPTEPVFPDGRVMELLDVTFHTNSGNWLDWVWEDLYLYQHDQSIETPEYATLQDPRSDRIRLLGNLANGCSFIPKKAKNTQRVDFGAGILWESWDSLRLCTPESLQKYVTTITTE